MFTGIVEEVGTVLTAGNRLQVACRQVLTDATPGCSIAVNGVCLTAVLLEDGAFWMDLAPETLARTNLGDLQPGSLVNLERPLALGDRLSGHLVQGHVDGTAEFLSLAPLEDGNWWLQLRMPRELDRYLIFKGSVTLDGISLTIARLEGPELGVAILPHTYQNTALHTYKTGARINVEVDMLAKYVEKLFVGQVINLPRVINPREAS
ncbi:MAG TPA: riboflavin synthase [Bryobacteraceae bacterium]|nr:riboflavin synthase [Bryobacteraceae bacterium]